LDVHRKRTGKNPQRIQIFLRHIACKLQVKGVNVGLWRTNQAPITAQDVQ
jgi:hypothetical protein